MDSEEQKKIQELISSKDEESKSLGIELKKNVLKDFETGLYTCRELQTEFPRVIIGGSLGLYLHNIDIGREITDDADIDIIVPYYYSFLNGIDETNTSDYNDFDYNFNHVSKLFNHDRIKNVEVKIDNRQKYVRIEKNNFIYNVSNLEDILMAKIRYSKVSEKHRNDVRSMLKRIELKVAEQVAVKIDEIDLFDDWKF